MRIVHADSFAIAFPRANMLHPADTRKSVHAWSLIAKCLPAPQLEQLLLPLDRLATDEELRLVHTQEYLGRLAASPFVADLVEVPLIGVAPFPLLEKFLLTPMRAAVRGTMLACEAALETGLAASTSGGFHRAGPAAGGGFSVYADAAIAIADLRRSGKLGPDDLVGHVDLDAQFGSGLALCFMNDPRIRLFDMFNDQGYPRDRVARKRLDTAVPVTPFGGSELYLALLRQHLPGFLDAQKLRLVIYDAGVNVVASDWVGGLQLNDADVLERDRFVIREVTQRGIPLVMLAGGGYIASSHRLLAMTLIWMAQAYAR